MQTPLVLLLPICLLGVRHHSAYLAEDGTYSQYQQPPANHSAFMRRREPHGLDFSWKTTSKPKFLTSKHQKVEPLLKVYPSDTAHRQGRSRDIPQPHQQPEGLKRVVYYATLPEISRYAPPVQNGPYAASVQKSQYLPTVQSTRYVPSMQDSHYAATVQDSQYVPPVQESQYAPPVQKSQYKPGQDHHYVPPVRESQYAALGQDHHYEPPVQENQYEPGQDHHYVPPVQESQYAPPGQDHHYVPPVQESPFPEQDHRYTDTRFTAATLKPYRHLPFTQQRSYDPNKVGKDFVTRVQSAVIDVRPPADKNKDYHSPSFTIIDANPNYADLYDRITVLNGGETLDTKDKYTVAHGYGGNSLMEPVSQSQSRPIATPYAISPSSYYMRPYYGASEMQKLVALPGTPSLNSPGLYTPYAAPNFQTESPYPTRHNRFPPNRYTPDSPLAAILGPSPARPSADMADPPYRFQHSVSLGPPTPSIWLPTSSQELNDNLGPSTFDHSSLRPLSYKNKFASHLGPYDAALPFGQKYPDFGTFGADYSVKPHSHLPFKPHFSQVSDWLTNKPSLDLSAFDLEDFNNALASSAASAGPESSSSAPMSASGDSLSLNGGVDLFGDSNNTIITPYLTSLPNTSSADSQDD